MNMDEYGNEIPEVPVVAEGEGTLRLGGVHGGRISVAAHVLEGREPTDEERDEWRKESAPKLALVPAPEVDPLVAAGVIAPPTIDPPRAAEPAKPEAPKEQRVTFWSPRDFDMASEAMRSASPKRRKWGSDRCRKQVAMLQDVLLRFAREAELSRAAFMKLAEYIGPEGVADALKTEPVAEPAPEPSGEVEVSS